MMKTKGVAFVLGVMSLGVAGLAQAETMSAAGGTAIYPVLSKWAETYKQKTGIMVIPFISAIMRDVFLVVPALLKESAYGLGATTWEVARHVVLPYTRTAISRAIRELTKVP